MQRKVYLTNHGDFRMTVVYEDEKMVDIYADRPQDTGILDRIYIGKVKHVVKNIQAAFVDIGGVDGYYSLQENRRHLYMNGKAPDAAPVPGDEIMVQVCREATKSKGPMVTANIHLVGRYMVLKGQNPHVGVSSKITQAAERARLREIFQNWTDEDYGFVVRTKAAGVSEEILEAEMLKLKEKYTAILEKGRYLKCFSEVYKEPDEYLRRVMQLEDETLVRVTTDIPEVYEQLLHCIDPKRVILYDDPQMPLAKLLSLGTKIDRLLNPHVWLKSGGSIVITPTEAMVVIDVNTGRYMSRKNQEETYFRINMEAAQEIFAQLRLRNLSGIIIIDFIDMRDDAHKMKLMEYLKKLAADDPLKATVVDMTKLNLVEITRKKEKKPLHEQMGRLCPSCHGRGYIYQ